MSTLYEYEDTLFFYNFYNNRQIFNKPNFLKILKLKWISATNRIMINIKFLNVIKLILKRNMISIRSRKVFNPKIYFMRLIFQK